MQLYLPTSPSFCSPLLLEAPVIKKIIPSINPRAEQKKSKKQNSRNAKVVFVVETPFPMNAPSEQKEKKKTTKKDSRTEEKALLAYVR